MHFQVFLIFNSHDRGMFFVMPEMISRWSEHVFYYLLTIFSFQLCLTINLQFTTANKFIPKTQD